MKLKSTRSQMLVSLDEALLKGLAADGGLFIPQRLPTFSDSDFSDCEDRLAIAQTYLGAFFGESSLRDALPDIVGETFSFDLPLVDLSPHVGYPLSVLELFHGPTAAFKDIGARFLAACLTRLDRQIEQALPLTILVATSGDTGGAVASAFHRRDNVGVVVLFPEGRVSARQQHQLTCWGDNVRAMAVRGAFDDCQRMVKAAFVDKALSQRFRFSSANSINFGRLLPQSVYYAVASLQYQRAHGESLNWLIPTGNLGNGLAAVMARACGLPIGDIVFVTNANRTLPDYFASGEYAPRESLATLASAMDVGAPSNLERLRELFGERDTLKAAALSSQWVSDEAIRSQIKQDVGRLPFAWCPHSATAMHTWDGLTDAGKSRHWGLAATAHPAKFESVVEPLIGQRLDVPVALSALLERPSHFDTIDIGIDALRQAL
ncbi:MAG: threonine synthase [Pseudomonadota bacterium]